MSRTIKEIYNEAVRERNKRMELTEFSNDSKMSIMNGLTWAFSAVIYSFETLLDVFAIDISTTINNRINGTPTYYANALLQYQKGDVLTVREDGLAFGYASVDETKRIITQVSYSESASDVNLDNKLILKVATGTKGNLSAIPPEELVMINAYIGQIKFAGTRIEVTSRNGDVLIPRVSVFYDGAVMESEIYDAIEEMLNEYIMNIDFDAGVYVSKVMETIKKVEHVTDVYIDSSVTSEQGVFLACYDANGHITPPQKISRMTHTSSGYIKQSTGKGEEQELPNFRQAIKLIIDNGCDTSCLQTN
ncbi:MAG: hypothetical protein EZS26_001053 [Candidatus Ordinivivax streblomastigis]|uniref:Baseplate protein J-like domain-containing protein n=1 Tax=Candidatus Ordinivivax streblomastigis TaxID=2540710 RepID=A0A5M8P347_9BACT|nr:MAG: hypothetical protein EZS26_001053 [Candidatus Ordinivivax streblomastigis]